MHRQALADKAAAIKAILAADQKESDWYNANVSEPAKMTQKLLQVFPEVVKRSFTRRSVPKVLPIEPRVIANLQSSADWMLEQKIISKRIDVAAAVCPTETAAKQ